MRFFFHSANDSGVTGVSVPVSLCLSDSKNSSSVSVLRGDLSIKAFSAARCSFVFSTKLWGVKVSASVLQRRSTCDLPWRKSMLVHALITPVGTDPEPTVFAILNSLDKVLANLVCGCSLVALLGQHNGS